MDEWSRAPVGQLFDVLLGKMLGAGSQNGEQFPYLANRNVQWGRVVIDQLGTMNFTPSERARYRLRRGDLLVCEGGEVGRAALWFDELSECYFQNAIHRLRPSAAVDSHFMRHYFEHAVKGGAVRALTGQTSIAHLPRAKLVRWVVPLPPLPEQRRIAEILDTIDETIKATERLVEKLRRMRDPILSAALRNEPNQRLSLGTLAAVTVGHVGPVAGAYTLADESVPLFNTGSITPDGLDLPGAPRVTMEFHRAHRGSALISGDVVVARHGDSGAAAVVPPGVSGAQALNVCIVRGAEALDGAYLAALLSYEPVRRDLVGWRAGSVQGVVNTARLRSLEIPVPPMDGQRRVSGRLDAWQRRVGAESDLLRKYQRIRAGLATDLLSGRVRTVAA